MGTVEYLSSGLGGAEVGLPVVGLGAGLHDVVLDVDGPEGDPVDEARFDVVEAREEILGLFEQVREPMSVPGKDLALILEEICFDMCGIGLRLYEYLSMMAGKTRFSLDSVTPRKLLGMARNRFSCEKYFMRISSIGGRNWRFCCRYIRSTLISGKCSLSASKPT